MPRPLREQMKTDNVCGEGIQVTVSFNLGVLELCNDEWCRLSVRMKVETNLTKKINAINDCKIPVQVCKNYSHA